MSWYRSKKVFLVGGTKGIGRAAALQLASAGAHVVVGARGQQGLDDTVAAMRAAGSGTTLDAVQVDVTDAASVTTACERAWTLLDGVDVLIINSGASAPGLVVEQDEAVFQQQLDLNYLGHVRCVQAMLPRMYERGSGHICVVSSMAAFVPVYGYAAYSASKIAVVAFAECVRQEAMLHGVTVTAHMPPTTDTPGLAAENEVKPTYLRIMEDESMFNSTNTAEDVAAHLLDSISRGRVHGYMGFVSWLMYFMSHHFPRTARWLADGELKTAIKKAQKRGLSEFATFQSPSSHRS